MTRATAGSRVAAIDCGTNSIRLLVAEAGPDGELVEVERRLELVRLGQGVDATGEFHPDALQRTFAAIDGYRELVEGHGCQRLRFVATSAARDANNREAFFDGVRSRLGVEAEVIAGIEEAALSFRGALTAVLQPAESVLVVDIGGGSTELVTGSADGQISHAVSLDVGSVRLRERLLYHDPPTPQEIEQATALVDELLDGSGIAFHEVGTFIGVAGTATSLAAIEQGLMTYRRELVDGSTLTATQIAVLTRQLLALPAEQVVATTCLPWGRAELVCAGALINAGIAARLPEVAMVVSESDILDALALGLLQD